MHVAVFHPSHLQWLPFKGIWPSGMEMPINENLNLQYVCRNKHIYTYLMYRNSIPLASDTKKYQLP